MVNFSRDRIGTKILWRLKLPKNLCVCFALPPQAVKCYVSGYFEQ